MRILGIVTEVGIRMWFLMTQGIWYLIQYKKNIQNLRREAETLRRRRDQIQKFIDEAKGQLEEPTDEVVGWLKEVEEVEREVDILENEASQLHGWFCSWTSCYGLSKKAVVEVNRVKKVYEKGIFSRVSCKPPLPSVELMHTDFVDSFMSVKSAMKQIMEALHDENIKLLGVYGMGGVGKTALMKRLNNELDKIKLFDKVIMVTVSIDINLKRIQDEMAVGLGYKLAENETEAIRANRLQKRLEMEKSVLIILDDVWSETEIGGLGVPFRSDHKGCKIILTTRMESVCRQMGTDQKVNLQVLSKEDSWNLFRMKAGNIADSPTLQPIAKEIAGSCGGLPLAIVAIASYLKVENDEIVWKDALSALRNPTANEVEDLLPSVIKSLRFSYDHLGGEGIKLFFLFWCLFPKDQGIKMLDLIQYGTGERLLKMDGSFEDAIKRGEGFVNKLMGSSLLLQNERGEVALHDMVRIMAIVIASREHGFFVKTGVGLHEWPEENLSGHRRISLMNNRITTLENKPKCPQLLTLLLSGNESLEKISNNFFGQMKALVVLDLSGTHIQQLPMSVSSLKNLRTLCLDGCFLLKDISAVSGLAKLEILRLKRCRIEELTEGLTGGWGNLKLLDLSYNHTLKRVAPKVISSLCSLEELNMEGSFANWEVAGEGDGSNADFSEVASLSRLTVLHVDVKNKKCPSQDYSGSFRKLKRFSICLGGDSFSTDASGRLFLRYAVIPLQDWIMVLVSKTEEMCISDCQNLKNLFQLYSGGLTFDNPSSVVEDKAVQNALRRLKSLRIEYSGQLADTLLDPHLVQQMCNLEAIKLLSCGELIHIFDIEELAQRGPRDALLSRLTELVFTNLHSLKSIWKGKDVPVGSLNSLRVLKISGCHCLKYVFTSKMVQHLVKLEELEVGECNELEEIVSMDSGNNQMMAVDNGVDIPVGSLNSLRVLKISGCHCLKYVFTSKMVQHLVKLEELVVDDCNELEEIVSMDSGNNQMMAVDKGVDIPVGSLNSLRVLKIRRCHCLKYVFTSKMVQHLVKLEELLVDDCNELEEIVSMDSGNNQMMAADKGVDIPVGTLSSLRVLKISGCHCLKYVFTSTMVQHLVKLEELVVFHCNELEEIVCMDTGNNQMMTVDKGVLPLIKIFHLSVLSKLTDIYKGRTTFDWPLLEEMLVVGTPNLKRLPLGFQSAPNLKKFLGGDQEWFDQLEWEDESIKSRLQRITTRPACSIL